MSIFSLKTNNTDIIRFNTKFVSFKILTFSIKKVCDLNLTEPNQID